MTTIRLLLSGALITACFLCGPTAEASEDWTEEEVDPLPWTMSAQGGAVFRMFGASEDPDAGTTYRVGFGLAASGASMVLRLDIDEYYSLSSSNFWTLRPGASFAVNMGDPNYAIRPILTGDLGAFFDFAPLDEESPSGASFDLGGGISFELEPGLHARLTYSFGFMLASETDDFGDTSLGFEGIRQSLTAGLQFIF